MAPLREPGDGSVDDGPSDVQIARETVDAGGGRLLELRGDEALCVFAP